MKILKIIICIISALILFSCNAKQGKQAETADGFKITPNQDTVKKVTQIIRGDTTTFDCSDFNDLKHNKLYARFFAGQINLPTGQVVCTDPMYRELALPQSWSINKGPYPVYLYIGLEGDFAGRIAYAEMIIKDEIPAFWEMSLISEKLLTDSFERKMNGMYPVENGLSCFADYETFKIYDKEIKDFYQLHKNGNYYNDILEKYFKESQHLPNTSRGEDWANYKPVKANGNIIMFNSGYGDGLYPRYVAYDKDSNVVKLVTDFIRLKEPVEE